MTAKRKRETKVFLNSPAAIERHLRAGIEPAGFDGNGVRFVLCDNHNRVLFHCHVADIPPDASCDDRIQAMSVVARTLSQGGDGAVLLALTRPGPPTLRPADRKWFQTARQVCAQYAVRLLGVHVVTPRGQREVRLDDAL